MPRLIQKIELRNFMSFGPDSPAVELGPLNVLIGPNGSGKSNLVSAIDFLRQVPTGFRGVFQGRGDPRDLVWKGASMGEEVSLAVDITPEEVAQELRYRVAFKLVDSHGVVGPTLTDERVERTTANHGHAKPYFYFGYEAGVPTLNQGGATKLRRLGPEAFDSFETVFTQVRDPEKYRQISYVAESLKEPTIYRDWAIGPSTPLRDSCKSDVRQDRLAEALDNLPIVLQALRRDLATKQLLRKFLADLSPAFNDFDVIPEGGRLQLYLEEAKWQIPANRLSDGTLRFLCLLALLVKPRTASLLVIEEPELGLHPDMMPVIAELLREAATTTQVIVTTHSRDLVDCFSSTPDVVLVCEKRDGQTHIEPANAPGFKKILERKSLGRMWSEGHIGGNPR